MLRSPAVILTREPEDNHELRLKLQHAGIRVLEYPCIQTVILPFRGTRVDGIPVSGFTVAAFTSRRAVLGFEPASAVLRAGSPPVLAAVGESTARLLTAMTGRRPAIVADPQTGENLAHRIADHVTDFGPNMPSVLHVRGNRVNPVFREILESRGILVAEQIVYRTDHPPLQPIRTRIKPVAVFSSPSAARYFFKINPVSGESGRPTDSAAAPPRCVAIGPVTAECLRDLGVDCIVQAQNPSVDAMYTAVITLLSQEDDPS